MGDVSSWPHPILLERAERERDKRQKWLNHLVLVPRRPGSLERLVLRCGASTALLLLPPRERVLIGKRFPLLAGEAQDLEAEELKTLTEILRANRTTLQEAGCCVDDAKEGRHAQLGPRGRTRRQFQHDDAPLHRRSSRSQSVSPRRVPREPPLSQSFSALTVAFPSPRLAPLRLFAARAHVIDETATR